MYIIVVKKHSELKYMYLSQFQRDMLELRVVTLSSLTLKTVVRYVNVVCGKPGPKVEW